MKIMFNITDFNLNWDKILASQSDALECVFVWEISNYNPNTLQSVPFGLFTHNKGFGSSQ